MEIVHNFLYFLRSYIADNEQYPDQVSPGDGGERQVAEKVGVNKFGGIINGNSVKVQILIY